MGFNYFLIKAGLIISRFYTYLMRWEFSAWGKRSRLGLGARLVRPDLVQVGNRVVLCEGIWLNAKDDRGDKKPTLVIGDGTYIGRYGQINAWRNVVIGKDVLIADQVFISDADHNFGDLSRAIGRQGDSFKGAVVLKDGCWIGIGVAILPGVTIGRNAIVGANSVVTSDVPDFAVVGGVPAKLIRQR
jgi:serine acetyltransferase